MNKIQTHYDNLKVSRTAPIEVIRAAYRSLSQKYHPDRNQNSVEANQVMRLVNQAYEVLSDPVKRKKHDEWIARQEEEQTFSPPPPRQPPPRHNNIDLFPLKIKNFVNQCLKILFWIFCIWLIGIIIYVSSKNVLQNKEVKISEPVKNSEINLDKDLQNNLNNTKANYQTSFDCNKAKSNSEILICNTAELAEADLNLEYLINEARNKSDDIIGFNKYIRKEWNYREKNCKDINCLKNWYNKQKLALSNVIQKGYMALIPVPLPETGIIGNSNFEGVAPLQVKIPLTGDSYFLKITNAYTNEYLASYFIRPGEILNVNLPVGSYTIKYALGKEWYGEKYLFGENTYYAKTDQIFNFQFNGYEYNGYSIELIQRQNGNLKSSNINKNQF
ncbi:hypothetical protein GCM10027155_19250 [Acinetobacter apis]|uniref:DnaJ domain-containing protein n=1 Tax=Acinetobacter apis TaxID=1229165 RepID=A0A217EIL4_9GAMM|nr:DnaJ domain-containing protein [Acinetobacter apis]SNQ30254.1 DnaJ domain-containing protein [Acinetobacter apis]